jgi:hypothetical protein
MEKDIYMVKPEPESREKPSGVATPEGECPFCRKTFDALVSDCFMVECSRCGRWTHRGCDGIAGEIYEQLNKPERADEPFRCSFCRKENESRFDSADLNAMIELDQEPATQATIAPPAEAWKAPPDLFATLWGITSWYGSRPFLGERSHTATGERGPYVCMDCCLFLMFVFY